MKKLFSLILVFIFIFVFSINSFAFTYTNDFPDYSTYSGGAYIEIEDNVLGWVVLVFPYRYIENTWAFLLDSNNETSTIINLTGSTVSGYLITNRGVTYNVRATSYSGFEYRSTSASNNTDYTSINYNLNYDDTINTNFDILVNLSSDGSNDDFVNTTVMDEYNVIMSCLYILIFITFFILVVSLFRKGRRS